MDNMIDMLPWLAAMTLLVGCSAFFSASEATLFYLRWEDRRFLKRGSHAQRTAVWLLHDPERLLSAVLFWNLVVNIAYFALASMVGLQIDRSKSGSSAAAVLFAVGSVLTIIFFSEMLPKSIAVLSARSLAGLISLPLAIFVRLVDPIMPALRLVYVLSRRLMWPKFEAEPYLELADLERAIELSTDDAELLEQEQIALRNIVQLSDIRADEWMRPRTQLKVFRPPVSLDTLNGRLPSSGYLLLAESDSDEIRAALSLKQWAAQVPGNSVERSSQLQRLAQPVIYVPWCSTVADAFDRLSRRDLRVAAVVNEFGETIGILTIDDILATVFNVSPSRSDRLLNRKAIEEIEPGIWRVAGMTSVRRLGRALQTQLPSGVNVTVAGAIQEVLERVAEEGDTCDWGPFHVRVTEVPRRGQLFVELTRRTDEGASS